MAKNKMKNTEYYQSGQMRMNALIGLEKGRHTWAEKTRTRIDSYNLSPKLCGECRCPIPYSRKINKFCSRSCGAINNMRVRQQSGYEMSDKQRRSISDAVKLHRSAEKQQNLQLYELNPKACTVCNTILPYARRRKKSCSLECKKVLIAESGRKGGLKTATGPRAKRSKNEIKFFELCQSYFHHVTNNDPLFDGWDADVLIHDHKIAVLWNGDWHYKEMGCYNHSLKQVQNRDAYKISLIQKHGWTVHIIADTTDSPTSPADAFAALKILIETNV